MVWVKIININYLSLESPIKIHLAQGLATKEKMDFIIQKATELGVFQITPIITKKSKVKLKTPEDQQQKNNHWEAIAIAACCQCGRNIFPVINPVVTFDQFIFEHSDNVHEIYKFILSPGEVVNNHNYGNDKLKMNSKMLDLNKEILLMIGSESGFAPEELSRAINQQFSLLKLGPRILRTETAPIAAISIFQAKYGDLSFE